ncbi:MAG: hypothetical protein WDN06_11780 [Asticcacaulis sp.]
MYARGILVHGSSLFNVHEEKGTSQPITSFHAGGDVHLDHSTFDLQMDMSGATIEGELMASDLEVGGQLLMCGYAPEDINVPLIWFQAKKRVNVSGSTIRRDFDLTAARP